AIAISRKAYIFPLLLCIFHVAFHPARSVFSEQDGTTGSMELLFFPSDICHGGLRSFFDHLVFLSVIHLPPGHFPGRDSHPIFDDVNWHYDHSQEGECFVGDRFWKFSGVYIHPVFDRIDLFFTGSLWVGFLFTVACLPVISVIGGSHYNSSSDRTQNLHEMKYFQKHIRFATQGRFNSSLLKVNLDAWN